MAHENMFDEKAMEKNRGNPRSDALNTIFWGCILLWSGLVFLAERLGLLAKLQTPDSSSQALGFGRLDAGWSLVFLGTGTVFLVAALLRMLVPAYRRPGGGNLIIGTVCLGIGIGDLFNWVTIWPLLLILLGGLFLARGFLGHLK